MGEPFFSHLEHPCSQALAFWLILEERKAAARMETTPPSAHNSRGLLFGWGRLFPPPSHHMASRESQEQRLPAGGTAEGICRSRENSIHIPSLACPWPLSSLLRVTHLLRVTGKTGTKSKQKISYMKRL